MAVVTFTPFGRGGLAAKTDISTPYGTLKTLSGAIPSSCFSPFAGIPESWIQWDTHTHVDQTLSPDCLGQQQFGSTSRVLYAWTPKTLILFGSVFVTFGSSATKVVDSQLVTVRFASTSWLHRAFPVGTRPMVFLSKRENPTDASLMPYQMFLKDVTSEDFSFLLSTRIYSIKTTFYVDYLAIGVAPGYLLRPEG